MAKPTGLGKGLGSLIPNRPKPSVQSTDINNQNSDIPAKNLVMELPVDSVSPNPMQPRQVFGHQGLDDLVNSIRQYGILQPLTVTRKSENEYELIAGERRLRAAKVAGLKTVPAIIRDADELEKLELALIENIQRQDLNPIEKAESYYQLIDEFNLTQEEAAKRLGIKRSTLANTIRLLTLSPEIQKAIADDKITSGHARAILAIESPKERDKFFRKIMMTGMNVRDAEKSARVITKKDIGKKSYDPNLEFQKNELQSALGTKVDINKKGEKGSITVHFYSPEELQTIINRITKGE